MAGIVYNDRDLLWKPIDLDMFWHLMIEFSSAIDWIQYQAYVCIWSDNSEDCLNHDRIRTIHGCSGRSAVGIIALWTVQLKFENCRKGKLNSPYAKSIKFFVLKPTTANCFRNFVTSCLMSSANKCRIMIAPELMQSWIRSKTIRRRFVRKSCNIHFADSTAIRQGYSESSYSSEIMFIQRFIYKYDSKYSSKTEFAHNCSKDNKTTHIHTESLLRNVRNNDWLNQILVRRHCYSWSCE